MSKRKWKRPRPDTNEKTMLARMTKGGRYEEASGEKGSGVRRTSGGGTKDKTDDLLRNTENGLGEALTTNQGTAINDDQNTLKAGRAVRRFWKISFFAKRSRISITSEFRSVSSMRAAPRRMVTFKSTNR